MSISLFKTKTYPKYLRFFLIKYKCKHAKLGAPVIVRYLYLSFKPMYMLNTGFYHRVNSESTLFKYLY